MKIAIVAITQGGFEMALRIKEVLREDEAVIFVPAKIVSKKGTLLDFCVQFGESVMSFLPSIYRHYDGLICVMATGIVVRALGSCLRSKAEDPPVVVVDEGGQYAISLISGHLGGGNELARNIAEKLKLMPVITTATDVKGIVAVDVLAKKWKAWLEPLPNLAAINAGLVNEGEVLFLHDVELPDIPSSWAQKGYKVQRLADGVKLGKGPLVLLTSRVLEDLEIDEYIFIRPRSLVAGIGCRKGVATQEVIIGLKEALNLVKRSEKSLRCLATIDFKLEEPALIEAAAFFGIPLVGQSLNDIKKAFEDYPGLAKSDVVKDKIGVDGVCEPACLLVSKHCRLILPKLKLKGITVALGEVSYGWWE